MNLIDTEHTRQDKNFTCSLRLSIQNCKILKTDLNMHTWCDEHSAQTTRRADRHTSTKLIFNLYADLIPNRVSSLIIDS